MFSRLLAPALLMVAAPASAADINISAYPELAPDALLPPIMAALKRTLKDPYSIRDMVLCPAGKVKLKQGKPVSWSVQFSLNAKNSYGGYTGVQTYAAIFRNGRLSGNVIATGFPGGEGIAGLINSEISRQLALCPTVSDEKVQQLLSPAGSALKPVE